MKTKKDKQKTIQDLVDRFNQAKGYLIINLLNLNSQSQVRLREALKANNSLFQVVKKTLVYKANPNFPFKDEELKTPFALVWNFDPNFQFIATLKKLKEEGLQVEILKGYLWNKILSQKEIEEILNLPSKDELISMLISHFKRELFHFNFVLSYPLRKLIFILSEIKNKN